MTTENRVAEKMLPTGRCFLWFHAWSRWTDPEPVKQGGFFEEAFGSFVTYKKQARVCVRCRVAQERRV